MKTEDLASGDFLEEGPHALPNGFNEPVGVGDNDFVEPFREAGLQDMDDFNQELDVNVRRRHVGSVKDHHELVQILGTPSK